MPCSLNYLYPNGHCAAPRNSGYEFAGCECPQSIRCAQWDLEMESSIQTEPRSDTLSATQKIIKQVCSEIADFLIAKNRKYGDSAVHPKRIFSRADAVEQINVRLDDKISRIMSGQVDEDEDLEADLVGYLILKMVTKKAVDKWQK